MTQATDSGESRLDVEGRLNVASWLDAMVPLLDLPVAADYRPGVLANLKITAEHAAILDGFAPDDHLDPAPVFVP